MRLPARADGLACWVVVSFDAAASAISLTGCVVLGVTALAGSTDATAVLSGGLGRSDAAISDGSTLIVTVWVYEVPYIETV